MNNKTQGKDQLPFFLPVSLTILFSLIFSVMLQAQGKRAVKGETATCTIKISNESKEKSSSRQKAAGKTVVITPNELGYFDPVYNVKPMEKVPVEVAYPNGRAGEKVVIIALDGGKFDDGKAVKVILLNSQKKCSFTFQVSDDAGIYQLMLRKGQDQKMIQLYIAAEPKPVKK